MRSHRFRSSDITEYQRRLHPPHSVGLNPAVLREYETGKFFTEIFNHIIALKLAMHQNVKADALLKLDALINLLSNKGIVGFMRY